MDRSVKLAPINTQSSLISIVLENPWKAYFSGEMVFGSVIFHARENQSVQTFSVYLRGEYYCKKGDSEHAEIIFVESSPKDLRGAGEGNVEMEFNLVLRPTSPTSIQCPLGGVRYRVLASVVFREGGSLRIAEASQPISVNHPLQLPESCTGRQVRTSERAGLVCCVGSVAADLAVSAAFLLSGQPVIVSGSVFNGTHSTVRTTAVNLVQSVQRQRDGKKMKRTVTSLRWGPVLPGKRMAWPSDYLVVPPLPPTSADPFFKTWYEVVMEMEKVGGKIIKLKIPVVIGNMAANQFSLPAANTGDRRVQWKSSEPQNESDEFFPLYITRIA